MKRGFWGSAKPAALPLGEIKASTIPVTSLKKGNYEPILRAIGDSSVVMIGESTHGTQEYYQMRAEITKALITRYGFNIVAVEGDWPDVYRVNRFVQQGQTADRSAVESLADFERFPKWMWRNEVVVEFIEWLEQHNRTQGAGKKTGFYGLDLYSMYASSHKVIEYLEKVDPPMARLAKKRYGTLDRFRDDPHEYATEVMLGLTPSCEREVIQMLTDIVKKGPEYMKKLGYLDGDELFYTKENATLVKDAEEYYRKAYAGGVVTWNLRDRHMMQTLEHLLDYQSSRSDRPAKAVVWAHNSHLGDARATNVSRHGEWNIGQLVREKFGLGRSYNIGFTTFNGTVRAAKKWGGVGEVMELNDALPDSYETLFHNVVGSASKERDESKRRRDEDANKATGSGSRAAQPSTPPSAMEVGGELVPPPDGGAAAVDFGVTEESDNGDFALVLRTNNKEVSIDERLIKVLLETRPERAVGVQYVKNPQREVTAHYFDTCLPRQFDSVIHIDKTSALQALEN